MDRTSPDIVRYVEKELMKKFNSMVSVDFTEIGGINYVADIMNNMDRGNEKFIFDELNKRMPDLVMKSEEDVYIRGYCNIRFIEYSKIPS